MTHTIRVRGESRLDSIIYEYYGTLNQEVITSVLEANPGMLSSSILMAGDVIELPNLPDSDQDQEVPALW